MPKNKQKKQKKQQKENNKQINNENNENNVESGCPECDGCLAKKKYDIAIKALKNLTDKNDNLIPEKMLLKASKHIIKLIHSDEFSDIENTDSVIELYKSISLNLHSIYYIRIFTSTTSLDVDIYKLLASTYLLAANKYEPQNCNCLKCIVKQK